MSATETLDTRPSTGTDTGAGGSPHDGSPAGSASLNPLVAQREESRSAVSGSGVVEDIWGIAHGLSEGSWLETGLSSVSLVADAVGVGVDPLGTLIAWGAGWLIDHFGPLKSWMDQFLGDADSVRADAATWSNVAQAMGECADTLEQDERGLMGGQVVAQAQANGVPHSWITAAQQSPIWKLITEYEVALPLHPEFRTLPMVWYVPPLSPVVDQVTASGSDGEDHRVLLSAISQMRIPLEYLAGLFSAGDTAPVELSLRRLAAMRSYMRDVYVGREGDEAIPASVGMSGQKIQEMYRLLSIAKYDDRYVIPTAHPEMPRGIKELEGCPVSYDAEAFHGMAPATSNRPMGGSSPEGRTMLPLEVVR